LKSSSFKSLTSLLVGAAWALAIVGASIAVYLFHSFGFISVLFVAFLAALPGLLCVVILELARLQIKNSDHIERQTKILESIEALLHDRFVSHN
jgi:hypothetical protein